jgi:hypothetical protein
MRAAHWAFDFTMKTLFASAAIAGSGRSVPLQRRRARTPAQSRPN